MRFRLGLTQPNPRSYRAHLAKPLLTCSLALWSLSLLSCGAKSAPLQTLPGQDFSVALSPSTVSAAPGSSTAVSVSVAGQNGFSGAVSVSLSGLPAGATTSPASPFSLVAGGSQTVTLSIPSAVSPGSYKVIANGTSAGLAHSASLALTVSNAPGFSITLAPSTISTNEGSSNSTVTVSIAGQNGFTGAVTIMLSGLPGGTTTSPACPFSVDAGGSQIVTLSIPSGAPVGSYTLTASGTSGSLSNSATSALTVNPLQDFGIGLSPSTIIASQGSSSSTLTTSISVLNGFSSPVSVVISGLPAGATTTPAFPFSVNPGSSQKVSLNIPSSASTGSYTLLVSGTAGALGHSASVPLTVIAAQDFSMGLFPATLTVGTGASTSNFAVEVTGSSGFIGPVSVTLSGLPGGTTTSPAMPFNVGPGSSQTVNLFLPSTVSAGVYSVTASGVAGGITHDLPLTLTVQAQTPVATWHYDNARDGANTSESILTTSNVNSATFGKLATLPVDGIVVGHPLYLPGVNVAGQGIHNVIYVATMHDSVYAFDADSTSTTPLWMTSLLTYSPPGAVPTPATIKKDPVVTGWSEIGVVSTPVIDPVTGILYLVAETYENGNVVHRLHALDVTSGLETLGGPTTMVASYTLDGVTTTFADLYQLNRPGLLLANGHVYAAFGSNCCNDPSQGWVVSYNASTLQQEGAYTTEPGKTLASIWQKGGGISADSAGNMYAETGEGYYAEGTNLSISVLKLSQAGAALALSDWFTPYNQQFLSTGDKDLNDAVLILPDQQGPALHEAIAEGKEGTIYLLNRDFMGEFCTTCTSEDTQIVQEIPQGAGTQSGTPVYWNNMVYFTGTTTPVEGYAVSNGMLLTPPAVQSSVIAGGGRAIVTSNGTSNGILWLLTSKLLALDATTLATLYTSDQAAGGRDTVPGVAHFATPIAADGKVFIGTQNSVVVYGLLP